MKKKFPNPHFQSPKSNPQSKNWIINSDIKKILYNFKQYHGKDQKNESKEKNGSEKPCI